MMYGVTQQKIFVDSDEDVLDAKVNSFLIKMEKEAIDLMNVKVSLSVIPATDNETSQFVVHITYMVDLADDDEDDVQ